MGAGDALRGVFVTGTDTGVGKSILAAAICAALAGRGERVAALKPAVTGLDEPSGEWPADHELLAEAASADQAADAVAPYRFGPPVSPHLAAELAGERIEPPKLLAAARGAASAADALVVEGVGGLLVPLTPGYLIRDLAVDIRLPVVIAARAGLGTINHTLLTIEAARAAGLRVAGVVMTPWPPHPEPIEHSNRETLERLAAVRVSGLPRTRRDALVEAGTTLPLDAWLGPRTEPRGEVQPRSAETRRRNEVSDRDIPG
jgi:dethiobiotin synthetase